MARHLSTAGRWIDCRPNGFVKHLGGCDPELETERSIAIVGIEPIIGRLEDHPRRGEDGFVAGARDLKEDLVLPLELYLFVV